MAKGRRSGRSSSSFRSRSPLVRKARLRAAKKYHKKVYSKGQGHKW